MGVGGCRREPPPTGDSGDVGRGRAAGTSGRLIVKVRPEIGQVAPCRPIGSDFFRSAGLRPAAQPTDDRLDYANGPRARAVVLLEPPADCAFSPPQSTVPHRAYKVSPAGAEAVRSSRAN